MRIICTGEWRGPLDRANYTRLWGIPGVFGAPEFCSLRPVLGYYEEVVQDDAAEVF